MAGTTGAAAAATSWLRVGARCALRRSANVVERPEAVLDTHPQLPAHAGRHVLGQAHEQLLVLPRVVTLEQVGEPPERGREQRVAVVEPEQVGQRPADLRMLQDQVLSDA